jgi:hypothetical protein
VITELERGQILTAILSEPTRVEALRSVLEEQKAGLVDTVRVSVRNNNIFDAARAEAKIEALENVIEAFERAARVYQVAAG